MKQEQSSEIRIFNFEFFVFVCVCGHLLFSNLLHTSAILIHNSSCHKSSNLMATIIIITNSMVCFHLPPHTAHCDINQPHFLKILKPAFLKHYRDPNFTRNSYNTRITKHVYEHPQNNTFFLQFYYRYQISHQSFSATPTHKLKVTNTFGFAIRNNKHLATIFRIIPTFVCTAFVGKQSTVVLILVWSFLSQTRKTKDFGGVKFS